MECVLEVLRQTEQKYGSKSIGVMGLTSHHHLMLFQSFRGNGYEVIVVNPIKTEHLKISTK